MAIYHLSVKPISRSAGRSATASAAYRAGEAITDERTSQTHDYSRKGGVESADIVLPDNAPAWAKDRAALWNAAERSEKRKDACVAREYEVALPSDLPPEERRRLALDFAREMANREGCAVDVCIHAPGRGGDERNHHAHLLRTTRKVEAEGLGAKLDTEKAGRNRKQDLDTVRGRWAELVNERLRQHGVNERIDHRSLEAQGIDRLPTQHLGPVMAGMARRGASSEVARRMAEEAVARETGRIAHELDQAERSILGLSGDLADVIRERDGRQRETERPKGAGRPGPAVASSRFKAKPEAPQPARRVPRPGSIEAVAADLGKIDWGAPIEQQAADFMKIGQALADWRHQKAIHASQRATKRCERRWKATIAALETSLGTEPTGLLGVFKRKAHAVSSAAHTRANALYDQSKRLMGKMEDVAEPEAVKRWTWATLASAAPELAERVQAHQAEVGRQKRQQQALERERQRKSAQSKSRGPRR